MHQLRIFLANWYKIRLLRIVIIGIIIVGLLSQQKCSRGGKFPPAGFEDNSSHSLKDGLWKFNLFLPKATLPFFCQYTSADSSFTILNATEKIVCKPAIFKGDSIFFSTPVFENIFCLKRINEKQISGEWINTSRSNNYRIKVNAEITSEKPSVELRANVTGEKWEATFGENNEAYKAVGVFNYFPVSANTKQTPVTGTFLTETGDFRYLEGSILNKQMTLSCFDGSHAFLFTAQLNSTGDSIIHGSFYSGTHSEESWVAVKNPTAELRNPDSLTTLKAGIKTITFDFPDLKGTRVVYPSKRFENKVTLISIMGSWCPNCMDETIFMQSLKTKYASKGLEIVALCFERTGDYTKSVNAVNKLRTSLHADFDFLIAGAVGNDAVIKALPALNNFLSYPTTIYIDKKGVVRKIYTGFYGPSTGSYYKRYTDQTENFIEKLLMGE